MSSIELASTLVLIGTLAVLVGIDVRERRLPDGMTLPLLAAGLGLGAWKVAGWPVPEILGAVLGYSAFASLGALHHRLRGTEGLGLGDAKLLAAAGAWLGWRALPLLVLLAAVGALIFVAAAAAVGRPAPRQLPFGPWLSGAFLVLWMAHLLSG